MDKLEIVHSEKLSVEIGVVRDAAGCHLVAFVGGDLVFQYTYSSEEYRRQLADSLEYLKKNVPPAITSLIRAIGIEAVEVIDLYKKSNHKKIARNWARETARMTSAAAEKRLHFEIIRQERHASVAEPKIRNVEWRWDLLRRSLDAIQQIRSAGKRPTQRSCAPIVYSRSAEYGLDSAVAQYSRELREAFGRQPSQTFEKLLSTNKIWDELSIEERDDLSCPETARVNRRRRNGTTK